MKIKQKVNNVWKWTKNNADLLLITLLGAVARAFFLLKDDLWYDEAFTGNLMRVDMKEFWRIVSLDPHPPLFSVLLRGWTYIVGVNDFTLRFLPFIFGIAIIVFIYLFVKEIFNKETAAIAAFLGAVNPFLVEYSVEARSYTFYALATLVAAYLLVKKKTYLFVLAIILMINIHYMAIAYIPVLLFFYLWTVYKNKLGLVKHLAILIPFFVVAAFLYYPVLTSKTNNNLNIDWVKRPSLESIPRSITAYSYGVKSKLAGADELLHVNFILDEYLLGDLVFILFALGLIGVFVTQRKNKERLVNFAFVNLMLFLPMLTLLSYVLFKNNNIYIERYLIPSSVFFVISLAYMLSTLMNFEVAGLLIFFYIYTLSQIQSPGYYTGMKQLAAEYKNSSSEIVFTSPIDYVVGKYYLNNGKTRLYVPKEPNHSYLDWPFMSDSTPQNLNTATIISPDTNRMTPDFSRPLENYEYGNYQVWLKNGLAD